MGAVLGVACTAGGAEDAGPQRDAGRDAAPRQPDAGPQTCDTSAECDDTFGCTIDECIIGNVCRHDPLDGRCDTAAGERCVVGRGCVAGTPTDCDTDVDCDDGDVCNGEEQCIVGGCFMGTALSCGDGNACTADTCDPASGCEHELICDGGTTVDAGPGCDAFDATTDYSGTFALLPGRACDAGLGGGYTISSITFSVAAGVLRVNAGPFTLTQDPAPTGGTFDVSGSNSCASVRLTGMFECEARFRGTWTVNHLGECSTCGSPAPATVAGRRS
jgi:hypothetical protein